MYLNQTAAEELAWVADYLSDMGIGLATQCPTLAGALEVVESGAKQPEHDLSRWPLVDGIDCSPDNVQAWVESGRQTNARWLAVQDKYDDLLATIRSRAEDVLREVSELGG